MCEEYTSLVTAAKALTQGEEPNTVTLPMAEDEWNTRPETVSYGTIRLDFETDALTGDDRKHLTAYEGSLDLYSLERSGAGWVQKICDLLTEHCGAHWSLNLHMYERDTGLFHWEFVYQVEG